MPTTLDEVRDDSGRRLDAARARALERDLADRVALQHHRVERAVDLRERMRLVDEGGLYAHVEVPVDKRRDADQPDDHAELAAAATSSGSIVVMPRVVDVVEHRRAS